MKFITINNDNNLFTDIDHVNFKKIKKQYENTKR